MESLKGYPSYKDTNINWLGEIPKEWELSKIKYQTSINAKSLSETTNKDFVIQYIDIGNVDSNGNILNIERYNFGDAPSRARRIVKNGDTIVSTVRTYLRAITSIEDATENLVCSTGFAVLTPKNEIDSKYLSYLIRSTRYVDEIVRRSTGVSYPAITSSEIGNLECILPDLKTQSMIGNFLNEKTSQIDSLISGKEKLIELLEEKRQAIITEAITKGLNPNVRMKESSVDWIGELPEHWHYSKINYYSTIRTGGTPDKNNDDYWENGTINWMSSGEVNKEIVTDIDNKITMEGLQNSNARILPINTVMIALNGQGKTKGKVAVLKVETTCNQSLAGFICDGKNLYYGYLYYFLKSKYKQLRGLVGDGLRDGLSIGLLKTLQIPLPPIDEQIAIANYLEMVDLEIGESKLLINNTINRLKEYRQSLIYEAVTGKIDVRDYNKVLS